MARAYKMGKRAEARDEVRERILRATMALHDRQGVVATTLADIAKEAGVGAATVLRHFPTPGELVRACGGHVWAEMQPPLPHEAAAVFEGLATTDARLRRLVALVDAFYARGALRLRLAGFDRHKMPELDGFLTAVEAGVEALVREALKGSDASEAAVRIALAQMSFLVFDAFSRLDLPADEFLRVRVQMLRCALAAAQAPN